MRTLLNESLPPRAVDEQTLSFEPPTSARRTFSQDAVLGNLDNLVEVGLGGTVIATPGAGADQAPALECGMTLSETPPEIESVRPIPANEAPPTV